MPEKIYDYIVIGSGFGGSVSAFRLAQKGYRVAVIESGKRFASEDFPKSNWNLRKFLWLPKIFCYGIQRMNLLNDVLVLSGAGVGGGSLVYAATLYVPPDEFFEERTIRKLGGKEGLLPYYRLASLMLGVAENPYFGAPEAVLKETAEDLGFGHTFRKTPVGICFEDPEKPAADPYFSGEGPPRQGCEFCGGCMVGCRVNAKNTLDKNYLYFAEKLGTEIVPETKAVEIRPLDDGTYAVATRSTTGLFGRPRRTFHAKGVVVSAGTLGTLDLLLGMKAKKLLPGLSDVLGRRVRTNSEAIIGATSRKRDVDYSKGVAITSSVHPDPRTHIEPVRYPAGSSAMYLLETNLTDGGGKIPRPLRYLGNVLRHPLDFLRTLVPYDFARRSIILLVMQTVDNSIRIVRKRRWFRPFSRSLGSKREGGARPPTYIPVAHTFARSMAKKMDAIPGSSIPEVLLDTPTTAHILGGCAIAENENEGVVDLQNRVFGHENLLVCDGSMVPVNLGVNPSLTIAALTERAMSFIPPKGGRIAHLEAEHGWGTTNLLHRTTK